MKTLIVTAALALTTLVVLPAKADHLPVIKIETRECQDVAIMAVVLANTDNLRLDAAYLAVGKMKVSGNAKAILRDMAQMIVKGEFGNELKSKNKQEQAAIAMELEAGCILEQGVWHPAYERIGIGI